MTTTPQTSSLRTGTDSDTSPRRGATPPTRAPGHRGADESPGGPPRSERWPAWLRAAVPMIMFLPLASTALLLLLIPGMTEAINRDDLPGILAFTAAGIVTLAAYVGASAALIRGVDRRPLRDLGLRPGRRALVALLLGIAVSVVIAVLATGATAALGWSRTPADLGSADAPPPWFALALLLVSAFLVQGIGEEVLFRGYLLQSLRRWPVLAVLISAVAFTLPHLASSGGQQSALEHVLYLATPFGLALSAAVLAIALRSVWAAVGIHGGIHLGNASAAALGLSTDGPAVWAAVAVLHVLVALAVGAALPRRRWDEVRDHGPYALPGQ